jgi:hypothetical protein
MKNKTAVPSGAFEKRVDNDIAWIAYNFFSEKSEWSQRELSDIDLARRVSCRVAANQ